MNTKRLSISAIKRTIMSSSTSSSGDSGDGDKQQEQEETTNLNMRTLADVLINGGSLGTGTSQDPIEDEPEPKKNDPPRLCLAIAGGGSPALSALTSTPNASKVLLEGLVCYDRRSFADFVGQHPAPSSDVVSQLTSGVGKNNNSGFSFSSATAAHLLSNAALHRALQLSPSLKQMGQCIGVGCASALVSESRPDKSSRAHVVITKSDGGIVKTDLRMSNKAEEDGGKNNGKGRRNRGEEDDIVGSLVLASVLQSRVVINDGRRSNQIFASVAKTMLGRMGDEVDLSRFGDEIYPDDRLEANNDGTVRRTAESIIAGETEAVVLVPDDANRNKVMKALQHPVLPPDPLIFPGSFNPPHIGHVALANAAVKAMMRKRAQEKEEAQEAQGGPVNSLLSSWGKLSNGASNVSDSEDDGNNIRRLPGGLTPSSSFRDASTHGSVWGAADHQDEEVQPTVLFEMSLTNPDKPPMEAEEAARRVGLFGSCLDVGADGRDAPDDVNMPDDWGVLMTSAPLFVQKVGILGQLVAPSGASIPFLDEAGNEDEVSSSTTKSRRKLTFVIGRDTMVRIINPKYYGNSVDGMLAAVREMGAAGVHFVVGGRLEQGKDAGDEPKFITGEDELTSLPADVRDMFTIVQEEDFRLDISSTELRNRAAAMQI